MDPARTAAAARAAKSPFAAGRAPTRENGRRALDVGASGFPTRAVDLIVAAVMVKLMGAARF